jgi:hypothetical protein
LVYDLYYIYKLTKKDKKLVIDVDFNAPKVKADMSGAWDVSGHLIDLLDGIIDKPDMDTLGRIITLPQGLK